jgi:hypothetical protein
MGTLAPRPNSCLVNHQSGLGQVGVSCAPWVLLGFAAAIAFASPSADRRPSPLATFEHVQAVLSGEEVVRAAAG